MWICLYPYPRQFIPPTPKLYTRKKKNKKETFIQSMPCLTPTWQLCISYHCNSNISKQRKLNWRWECFTFHFMKIVHCVYPEYETVPQERMGWKSQCFLMGARVKDTTENYFKGEWSAHRQQIMSKVVWGMMCQWTHCTLKHQVQQADKTHQANLFKRYSLELEGSPEQVNFSKAHVTGNRYMDSVWFSPWHIWTWNLSLSLRPMMSTNMKPPWKIVI